MKTITYCCVGFSQALNNMIEKMGDLEQDIPLVKSCLSRSAARAVIGGVVSLAELSDPMTGGAHYPLFLLCLQQTHKLKDKQWLVAAFTESKLSLESMLPGRFKPRVFSLNIYSTGMSLFFFAQICIPFLRSM